MGRGDKRTRRGKITSGSFGNSRRRKVNKIVRPPVEAKVAQPEPVKEEPKKRAPRKKEK